MTQKFQGINFLVKNKNLLSSKTPLLFLHGFSGSLVDWRNIVPLFENSFPIILLDFPGHGKSDSPVALIEYVAETVALKISLILKQLNVEEVILIGYSMGGRMAQYFSLNYPELVAGVILESSSPGISNKHEKEKRQQDDDALAEVITAKGIEYFTEYWLHLPLFQSLKKLPNQEYINLKKNKLNNRETGLANSLKGFGTGVMPDLWPRISELKNVLLISGSYDKKFCEINKKMKELIPKSIHKIIDGAGHNVHLEKPNEFIKLVKNYLEDMGKNI